MSILYTNVRYYNLYFYNINKWFPYYDNFVNYNIILLMIFVILNDQVKDEANE